MEIATALLIGVVVGALGGVYFGRRLVSDGGPTPLPAPMCEALVRISLDGTVPRPRPDNACLAEGRSLTWEIENGDSAEIEIEFKKQNGIDGPFNHEPTTNPHNTEKRGKYRRRVGDTRNIRSNTADQIGPWPYTVKWTVDGTTYQNDPVICIRR